jgi:polyisoprenoid-binding protein YceI
VRNRRVLIIGVVVIIVLIAAILFVRDWVLPTFAPSAVTGVPTSAGAFSDLKTFQAQTQTASAPTAPSSGAMNTIQLVSFTTNKPLRPLAMQDAPLYESCTKTRGATPTPQGARATAAATAATSAVPAATQAAGAADYLFLKVVGTESEACYLVGEVFLGENSYNLAVGVTHSIEAEVAVDRNNIANSQISDITINISEFTSDQPRRDGIIRQRWLESNKFPFAKFAGAKIVGLPARPYKDGEKLSFQITGKLTVRDVTKDVTFNATGALTGKVLVVNAFTDILMTDFGFDPPSVGGFVQANNELRIVLNLVAREAGAAGAATQAAGQPVATEAK